MEHTRSTSRLFGGEHALFVDVHIGSSSSDDLALDRRTRHHHEYRLQLPNVPPSFPKPLPPDDGLLQRLEQPLEPLANTLDVGWYPDDNLRFSDSRDIRIPKLLDHGALFLYGPRRVTAQRYRRYVLGLRFSLDDREGIENSITVAMGQGRFTQAVLVLPDMPEIRNSYGPQLARNMQQYLILPDNQVFVSYHTYETITPEQGTVILDTYTARLADYTLHRDETTILGPLIDPGKESEGSVEDAEHSALLAAIQDIEQSPVDLNPDDPSGSELPEAPGQEPPLESSIPLPSAAQAPLLSNAPLPDPPSDLPSSIPLTLSSAESGSQASEGSQDIGQWQKEGLETIENEALCISNLVIEGALFIYGKRRDSDNRYLTGAKFRLGPSTTLRLAISMPLLLGPVNKIQIMLPFTPDTILRYRTGLENFIMTVLGNVPSVQTEFYVYGDQNAQNPAFAHSYTANMNNFEIEARTYPIQSLAGTLSR